MASIPLAHAILSNYHLQLYWDANGNLREVKPYDGYPRFHLWDDDDRMIASIGSHTCGYYGNASEGTSHQAEFTKE